MNDYRKIIPPNDPPPYEPIKVNPIEHDKKGREESYQELSKEPPKPMGFAILSTLLKQFISLFSPKDREKLLFFDQQQTIEDIRSFRKLLHILSQEDQSHNPEFAQHLSELWHNLQEDCNSIYSFSKDVPGYFSELKILLSTLNNFPPKEDHSLGYYLKESAGKEWIPFPFMEMLQSLHEESIEHPKGATLIGWISAFDHILSQTESQ